MDPAKVAEHLCLYDHKLYSKIHPQECFDWIKRQTRLPDKEGNLNVFIGTHDRVATWVKTTILDTEKVTKRADVVDFWIRVAEVCTLLLLLFLSRSLSPPRFHHNFTFLFPPPSHLPSLSQLHRDTDPT